MSPCPSLTLKGPLEEPSERLPPPLRSSSSYPEELSHLGSCNQPEFTYRSGEAGALNTHPGHSTLGWKLRTTVLEGVFPVWNSACWSCSLTGFIPVPIPLCRSLLCRVPGRHSLSLCEERTGLSKCVSFRPKLTERVIAVEPAEARTTTAHTSALASSPCCCCRPALGKQPQVCSWALRFPVSGLCSALHSALLG